MKKIIYLLIFPLFIILYSLFFIQPVQAANTATLTQTCGTGSDGKSKPVLNAEWNLDQGVNTNLQCNIYIRGSFGDARISTRCSGSYSSRPGEITEVHEDGTPINPARSLTDGGDYLLIASTGTCKNGFNTATQSCNPGGYIEVVAELASGPQYCQRDLNQGSSGVSNVETVFGKITPPQFIQNIGSGERGISRILTTVLNLIYAIAAIAFVFMIIWSAWQWITSGGEKDKVAAARQRLTYAIIGIVILALAGVIISVIGEITGFTFFSS